MKKKNILIIIILAFLVMVSIIIFRGLDEEKPVGNDETYVVQFYDHNDNVIKKEEVKKGNNAISPTYKYESKSKVFVGWDKSFNDITEDLDIKPVFEDISNEKNVIYSSYACSNGDSYIQVSFQITGDVNFCCLELEIEFDDKYLEFVEATEVDGDGLVNSYDGKIYFVFACAENINGSVDLMTLEFKVLKSNTKDNNLVNINVTDIASFDSTNQFLDEDYKVIKGDIILN